VQTAQKTRTEAQTKSAQADNSLTIFAFVSDVLGPNFNKEKLKITTPFFERVYRDQIEACKEVKEHFNRQRPLCLILRLNLLYSNLQMLPIQAVTRRLVMCKVLSCQ